MTQPTTSLRPLADMLCLWALCAKPACRRAQACRSDASACLKRYAPLVPEDARYGVLAILEAGRCGVSDAQMRVDAGAEIAAIETWTALAHAAAAGETAANGQRG